MLTGFIFPLGARRASDFFDFFKKHNQALSDIKSNQSKLLGQCQSLAMQKDWNVVAETLRKIAELEKEFKIKL